jgi:hypothetical protein
VAPALLVAGAGTAHADDPSCAGFLQFSFYCSPASGSHSMVPDYTEPRQTWMGPTIREQINDAVNHPGDVDGFPIDPNYRGHPKDCGPRFSSC